MNLDSRKRYLQIALNSTLEEAKNIISQLPISDRILIEAGTPLIKNYGGQAISLLKQWCEQRFISSKEISLKEKLGQNFNPYIVADLKTMDRGDREAEIAAKNGAGAAICLGQAPIETIDSFIKACAAYGIDSMIDMMNIDFPLGILRKLKKLPDVVIVHRGVDEEKFNREKMIPFHEIHRIKGNYDIIISVAGGDTIREIQRAIFNDADIVVVWKEFYQKTADTADLAKEFLKTIK